MKKLATLAVAFVALLVTHTAQAQSTWNQTSGAASWQVGTNWTPNGVPSGAGVQANLTSGLTANETVSLNGAVTLGTLDIGATSGNFAFSLAPGTSGSLTMNSGTGAGALISESSFNSGDTMSSAISMADTNATTALTITSADVTGKTFTISGGITSTGSGSNLVINASGAGAINFTTAAINNQGTITNSGTSTGLVTISGGVGSNVTGITSSGSTSELLISSAITTNTSVGTTLTSTTTGGSELMDITGGIGGSGNLIINANGTNSFATGAIKIETGSVSTTGSILNSGSGTSAVYITSSITAASGVTENGTSPLALSGNNTYSGDTTLTSGQLLIGSATALGTGTLIINGGTIDGNGSSIVMTNNNPQTWNASFGYTGARALTFGTGAITLGGNVTLTTSTHANLLTENGAISGTGNLTFDNNVAAGQGVTLAGAVNNIGTITNSGTSVGPTIISGNIGSNVGLITENSSGISPLILSGTNTNVNGVTLTAGTLKLGSTTALGATASTLTITSGTIDNSSGGTLSIANANAQNWNGSFTFTGSNNLDLGAGAVTLGLTPTVTVSANTLTEDGAIGGGFGLTLVGPGTLVLTGANTYTGVTTVTSGTLSINSIQNVSGGASALGAPTTTANGTIALGGGTLQYTGSSNGSSNRVVHLTSASTLDASGTATFALSGGVTATNLGLTLLGSGLGTESAAIATGSGTLSKNGTGTWVLSGANTYTGNTKVLGGMLEFANASSLYNGATGSWTAAKNIVSSGATLAFNVGTGGFTSTQIDTLNTNLIGGGTAAAGFIAGSKIGFDTTGADFTYNTAITNNSVGGAVGLTKIGTNALILGGTNTYSGGTTVSAGALRLSNSSGSATGAGTLSVARGATLEGKGTSNSASFAIGTGASGTATVLVGQDTASDVNTTSTMTLNGSTGTSTIANANLVFNLNANTPGAGNQLLVGNTNIAFNTVGAINTTLTLNLQGNTPIAPFTPYILIAGTGATTPGTTTTGQYTGLSTFVNGLGQNQILTTGSNGGLLLAFSGAAGAYPANSYLFLVSNGSVDDIEVEVVPEPSTWALMFGGLALLIVVQRSRRKGA